MNINELQSFPDLFIFDQLRVIDQIISLTGGELNPNESILLILSDSLRKASHGGRIEISKRLPDWMKKKNTIFMYLPSREQKLICLNSLLLNLKDNEEIFVQEVYLNQISELISGSSQSEYSHLVEKLPRWIQECDIVFYHLSLEDKINILCDKLENTEITHSSSIIQQIVKTLAALSEDKYNQLLTRLPSWVIEKEEILPFLSRLSMQERESLFQIIPDKIKSNDSVFTLLSLENKLDLLLRQMSRNDQFDFDPYDFREFIFSEITDDLKINNLDRNKLEQWLSYKYESWFLIQESIESRDNYFNQDKDFFQYVLPSLEDVLKIPLYSDLIESPLDSCCYTESLIFGFIDFLQQLGINVKSLDPYSDISGYYELFFDLGVSKEVISYLIPALVRKHLSGDWGSYGECTETISILSDEDSKMFSTDLTHGKRNMLAIQKNSGCVKSHYLLKDVLSSVPNDLVGDVSKRWGQLQLREAKMNENAAIIVYNELPSTAVFIELSSLSYEGEYEEEEKCEVDYEDFFIDFDESWVEQYNVERDFEDVEDRILSGYSLGRLLDENQAGWL